MNERDKTAQMMQDSAGNSWGTEAHFQAFAALIRADTMEAATRAANVSWSLACKKMVELEREACAKVCDEQAGSEYWEGANACARNIRARDQS